MNENEKVWVLQTTFFYKSPSNSNARNENLEHILKRKHKMYKISKYETNCCSLLASTIPLSKGPLNKTYDLILIPSEISSS